MFSARRRRIPLTLAAFASAVFLVGGLLATPGSAQQARTAQATGTTVIAAHSGQALDVSGVSHAAGARVIQWPPNGGANQRWTFEALDDGTYRIVVAHSGQVLDVAGASEAAGAHVIQWPWNGGANQRWRVEDVSGEGSRIVAAHSGLVLDVAGASHAAGAHVVQWPWNGGANQRWQRTDGDDQVRLTQLCTHRERSVTVTVQYPEGWHTDSECTVFDPEPFNLERGTEIPRDLAIILIVEPLGFDQAANPTGLRIESERSTTIDGQAAVRQHVVTTGEGLGPAGQEATRYVIDGGNDRSIIMTTWNIAGNDYGQNVEVLDAMANAFAIEPR